MKRRSLFHLGLYALAALGIFSNTPRLQAKDYSSLKNEVARAIERGNAFLKSQQHANGFWPAEEYPALTALALTAQLRDPARVDKGIKSLDPAQRKAFDYLLASQQADGGIYRKGLACYNTSASMMAMLASGQEEFHPAILKARAYLVGQQTDFGNKGETDDARDGGIGYGSDEKARDLSNTHLSLEAIHYSRHIAKDSKYGKQPELNWDAALEFVSRCQNQSSTNDQKWASDDPKNKGGFVYGPGDSKAGTDDLGQGRVALRSYGSMSYAGLLSFVYADLKADDPRVTAVKEWLGRNYTISENPGMGEQGLYYYYHTMAKALAAAKVTELPLESGKSADWRHDLANRILTTQRENGSWVNQNNRWWESDPILVTSYAVLALEQIYYQLP